jgi:uncharacterized protein (TIGR00725 family)
MIAVVGPGASDDETVLEAARRVGELAARAGHHVVTGGLGGVMAAASRGAREAGASVLGILPGDDPAAANPWVSEVLATGLGEGRNVMVVEAADAVVGVGGSWGTLSEIALARRMGKPVAWLHGWTVTGPDDPVPAFSDPELALAAVLAATRPLAEAPSPAGRASSRSS